MSGKWDEKDVPKGGWSCVHIEDLEEPSAICEMCEVQEIRYVHYMEHPDYPDQLGCGCICAGHMEANPDRARNREKALRNAAARRRRWLTRNWRTSRKRNHFLNIKKKNIVIYETSYGWSFRIRRMGTANQLNGLQLVRGRYKTSDAAKLGAFDALVWLESNR